MVLLWEARSCRGVRYSVIRASGAFPGLWLFLDFWIREKLWSLKYAFQLLLLEYVATVVSIIAHVWTVLQRIVRKLTLLALTVLRFLIGWNGSFKGLYDFLLHVQKVVMLEPRELGQFWRPDRLDLGMQSCCWKNCASDRILVLIEESNILKANQPEEVNVLLDVRQCIFGHMKQLILRRVHARGRQCAVWTGRRKLGPSGDPITREENSLAGKNF